MSPQSVLIAHHFPAIWMQDEICQHCRTVSAPHFEVLMATFDPCLGMQPVGGVGNVAYCSTLTNFVTAKRPSPFRGGILADDMGLGKTLTVLALIATNHAGVDCLSCVWKRSLCCLMAMQCRLLAYINVPGLRGLVSFQDPLLTLC